jgi:hypothetical protein
MIPPVEGAVPDEEYPMHTEQMIASHPDVRGQVNSALTRCVEACFDCAQACTSCADACVAEPTVRDLVQCIRLDLDCADICVATGQVATRRAGGDVTVIRSLLGACELACARCAAECERHAQQHDHCRICGEACRGCEQACRDALASLPDRSGAHAH